MTLGQSRNKSLTDGEPIEHNMGTKESQASNFLLSSFVALDIIACASVRSTPLLNIDHASIKRTPDNDSRAFTGFCDNNILLLIFEISQLDSWKKDANDSRRLSIVELAKRGSQLEERIHLKIAEISKPPSESD